mmetsp:Transcript_15505/g.28872  ORF Transcript_15505/g.28872 Transcript_15505/m.28872 type:complete len:211 (-) Transcript_15505:141-773(-)
MSDKSPPQPSPHPTDRDRQSSFTTFSFEVSQSVHRVRRRMEKTDLWIPLLFSMGCTGKRVKGKEGQVGAIYQASLYQSTEGFAKEKKESFSIGEMQESSVTLFFQPDRKDSFWLRFPEFEERTIVMNNQKTKALSGIPITLSWEDSSSPSVTKVTLVEPEVPYFRWGMCQTVLAMLSCCIFYMDNGGCCGHGKRKNHRDACHEELQHFLS